MPFNRLKGLAESTFAKDGVVSNFELGSVGCTVYDTFKGKPKVVKMLGRVSRRSQQKLSI